MSLVVGVPREVKTDEHRVAITPDGVFEMTHRDVRVLVETNAGADSGITDDDYRASGGLIPDQIRPLRQTVQIVLREDHLFSLPTV